MSNRGEAPQVLPKGVYVVSNGLMSEHWEKPNIYVSALPKSSYRCCKIPMMTKELERQFGIFWKMNEKIIPDLLPNWN